MASGRTRREGALLEGGEGRGPSREAVLRAVVLTSLAVFGFDLWLPSSVVLGSLFIVPVFASAWLASERFTEVVTSVCALFAIVGAVVGLGGGADAPPTTVAVQLACALFVVLVGGHLARLRVRGEEQLARSRELVATALASIADAVVTTDREDLVTGVNAPAERLLGWVRDDARGRPLGEVVPLERDPQTSRPTDPRAPRRMVLVARDGSRRPVEVTSAPMAGGRGQEFGRVLVMRDASDVAAFERRMRDLAYRDGLTGLANRRSLEERLDLELKRARRARSRLGLLFLDLDRFKEVNDRLGHRAGDELLVAVGQRLSAALREADTVARLAGDEFCVLVPELGSLEDAELVARKLLESLVRPVVLEGEAVPVSPSIGVAVHPDHAAGAEELLRLADAAMYRAKGLGGAGYAVHEGPARRHAPQARLPREVGDLERAGRAPHEERAR